MRSGTCPKCQASEVYAARNGLVLGDTNRTGLRPHLEPGFRGAARIHQTDGLWHYVCATCGYVEAYLHDEAAVAFVRQSWVRVTPT